MPQKYWYLKCRKQAVNKRLHGRKVGRRIRGAFVLAVGGIKSSELLLPIASF